MAQQKNIYEALIVTKRRTATSVEANRTLIEETASDRSRAIFAGPFRRLQLKAQVFSLETNAAIRSRLTHSLEVADYGKQIALKISEKLIEHQLLSRELQIPFVNTVETACLLHDIGNPPFGHFGEEAIKMWFKENWRQTFKKATGLKTKDKITGKINNWKEDFLEFDGNPQGFRIIAILQEPEFRDSGSGLNLTYSQLLTFLKYIRPADGNDGKGLTKKPGFFQAESDRVSEIRKFLKHNFRHPLTYIMEAADDISYCLSDLEDGIEKGILSERSFFEELTKLFNTKKLEALKIPINNFFLFKTTVARRLINHGVESYLKYHDEIVNGKRIQLFDESSEYNDLLKAFKTISRKKIYRSRDAEDKELAGYKIIYGLLNSFEPILTLSKDQFTDLLNTIESGENKHKNLDVELRLMNRLPDKFVKAYKYSLQNHKFVKDDDKQGEWFFRAHLIVDFISGMTDNFALELYKLLHGIKID